MARRVFCLGFPIIAAVLGVVTIRPSPLMEVVAGALISIWVTLLVEALQRPSLDLGLHGDGSAGPLWAAGNHGHVLAVLVTNKPLSGLPSLFFERSAALETRATITFRDVATGAPVSASMQARWSNSPQAVHKVMEYVAGAGPTERVVFDPERLSVTQSIPPGDGQEGALGVVIRFDGETDCYGVSNQSYSTRWRPEAWRLGPGSYLVSINVRASNARCEATFLLKNASPSPQQFRLEPAANKRKLPFRSRSKGG
jgi:hypothetical protein